MTTAWLFRLPQRRALGRRGTIALIAALAAPVMLGAVALGVEIAHWSSVQLDTQRIADLAALAGAQSSASGATAQEAANAAANVAELNGAAGATTRGWNATTKVLTDNTITVAAVTGVKKSSDPAFKVTVRQQVPLLLAGLISSASAESIGAAATGEVVSNQAWAGPQPCVVALQTAAQGGSGINYTGWATMNAIGCSVRSNAGLTETGSGAWNTQGIYAAGSVSIPFWVSDKNNAGAAANPTANAGTIPDPYGSDTALQTALSNVASTSGSSIACSNQHCGLAEGTPDGSYNGSYCVGQGSGTVNCTLQPGNYGSFNVTSGGPYYFTLKPGLYNFNGNINLTNYTVTNGSAVTILTSGTFNGANTFNFTVTAPTATDVKSTGGVAGIALAGTTSGAVTVSGNPQVSITGVMYFPNATFTGAGSTTVASSSCFELLAASISLSGDSGYSGTCESYGTAAFGSTYSSSSLAELVQ
ncbi:MAG: hypothetical protein KGI51_04240 [Rhodospirillales bacterium]|nr:hypothetical protein [Rhodospirillales bacterium]